MRVRKASVADAQVIAELNAVVQELHHRALPTRFKAPDPAAFIPAVEAWLADEARTGFLAELDDGEPAGYALTLRRDRPDNALAHGEIVVELDQLAVVPAHRRRGVGSALLRQIMDHARELRAGSVELSVHAFNEGAQAFFTASGFTVATLRMAVRPLGIETHTSPP